MTYSNDLRKRDFLRTGGKKSHRQFAISRATVYRWVNAENPLAPRKPGPQRLRVLDESALKKHVADFPDLTHSERSISVFQGMLSVMKTRQPEKKTLGYRERCDLQRAMYRQTLAKPSAKR